MRACFLECLRVNAYGKEFYGMHMLEGETEQSFVLADREREREREREKVDVCSSMAMPICTRVGIFHKKSMGVC